MRHLTIKMIRLVIRLGGTTRMRSLRPSSFPFILFIVRRQLTSTVGTGIVCRQPGESTGVVKDVTAGGKAHDGGARDKGLGANDTVTPRARKRNLQVGQGQWLARFLLLE